MNARSTSGALLVLLAATACTPGPEPYGVIRDAGLSPDGKTLLVLIEHGTKTTARGNIFRGDITTARPASMRIHGFDRSSGNLGPVSSQPPPAEANAAGDRLDRYAAVTGGTVASLKDCRALYTPCAEATVPNPYRVGGLIVDPQGRRSIEWNGERLVVAPFQALDAAQIRIAREALFRRSVERMRSAATQDFAARATKEDPERITTGEAGTAERDPGMTAFYQLLPGRVTMARFDYGGTTQFAVVWQRDGACVTDSVAVTALIAGCHGTDAPGLERAARGIPRTRPPDPDRMGTTWGVIDGSDMPPGTVTVACHGQPTQTAAKPCDERQGDTACRSALPMLCSKADAALPPRSSLARRLALTAPVRGTELLSVGAADKVCQAALGEGWRMTDGEEAGNKYQVTGIGNVPATSRFWVRAGEGSANCW